MNISEMVSKQKFDDCRVYLKKWEKIFFKNPSFCIEGSYQGWKVWPIQVHDSSQDPTIHILQLFLEFITEEEKEILLNQCGSESYLLHK